MKAIVVRPEQSVAFNRNADSTVYKMIYPEMGHPVLSLCFGKTVIKPGGSYPLHRHPVEEAYYILRGSGYLEVEGNRVDFQAGDAVFIEANVKHQAFNSSDVEPLEFVFSGGIMLSGCLESVIESWPDEGV
jgi:quercetin dioxygenase-like cupin family protein